MTTILDPTQHNPIAAAVQQTRQDSESRYCGLDICFAPLKALVDKIVEVVSFIWDCISLIFLFLRSRYCDGVYVPIPIGQEAERDPNACLNFYVRQFRVPAEIGPHMAVDPQLRIAQFTEHVVSEADIPEAPGVNIFQIVALFDQMVLDRVTPIMDEDTPATFQQLKAGLRAFIQGAARNVFQDGELRLNLSNDSLAKLLKHITVQLQRGNVPVQTKIECLLELARAGHRYCPTRMFSSARAVYERLKEEIVVISFPERVAKKLHDVRQGILQGMSGGDAHRYQEYLCAIGRQLGIQYASLAFNDNPIIMYYCAARFSLPVFFTKYTSQTIIEAMSNALNGQPIVGRPVHERAERDLPFDLATEWFLDNIPQEFHPEVTDSRERKRLYSESILDAQTNTFKREAIVYMLVKLEVLV